MHDTASLRRILERRLPSTLELLRQMVEINSYTANRAGVNRLGRVTADCFASLGFMPQFVPSTDPIYGEHLVLTRPGRGSRNLLLVSHLDTVFPPEEEERNNFHWLPEGDRIYGPGTIDIKGGTAMMWLVLHALREHAPHDFENVTWKLLWDASEETFGVDFGNLCCQQVTPQTVAALVFEGEGRLGEEGLLVVSRKGRASWRVTVSGRGAHAGGKHSHGANAIVQLGQTLQKIAALTDYSRGVTFNPGTISGGTVVNRVPHEAAAMGEFRALTPQAFNEAKAALLSLAGPGELRSPTDGYRCQIHIEIFDETRPWPRNAATDNLFALWEESGREVGVPVGPEERGGVSDGNHLWDAVPTIDGLGPWGDHDHCSERSPDGSKLPEYVEVASFVPKALLNVSTILKLLHK